MIEQLETIPFTKMQGAGNDFVVLDNRELNISKQELIELAPTICDRKFGVGSDGIMALFSPEHEEADYTMFFRNPDGSDAGMCGNGARCIAQFAHSLGFDAEHHFNVHDQLYQAVVEAENIVRISFPMQASATEHSIDGETFYGIHTGTEHLVHAVSEDLLEDEKALRKQGQQLRYHDKFQPAGTNVNFISGIDDRSLKLQTYERGVEDLTLACGTGAIAAALIWHHLQSPSQGPSPYKVETKGGQLTVYFDYQSTSSQYANIKLEGPAHFVFNGSYQL